ncbi:MAG TPA: hypothetical protein VG273_04040 [Bryobacteraceae bacterium]|jgi:hypothetical protein|nr:hypothetical protein [Bryobacteraceae bacterium]
MVLRLPNIKWNSFLVGATTTLFGGSILHPILVTVAKAGMGAASVAQDAWNEASAELHRVRTEAVESRNENANMETVLNEIRALRSDIAGVKAKVGIA